MRLRLIGGRLPAPALWALLDVAERYGDGRVRPTGRANLQLRALPGSEGRLAPDALAALERTGLLPSLPHELVRNVMLSPQSGLTGGRADLRLVATELDRLLCASPRLADLPGRFLFVLDDGRGDLLARSCDLGLVALDETRAQLRIGAGWGPVVALSEAAGRLAELATAFLDARGEGPAAAWHVRELVDDLAPSLAPDPRVPASTGPLPYGEVAGGRHVEVGPAGLDRSAAEALPSGVPVLVVTPWNGVLIPREGAR